MSDTTTSPSARSGLLRHKAFSLGFDLCGVAPAFPVPESERFQAWLDSNYAGEMQYMAHRREDRLDPSRLLPGVRSVVCAALSYNPAPEYRPLLGRHPISCYAWGRDYHEVLRDKLSALAAWMEKEWACHTKACVDTLPVLERGYAARAGLGWIGRNTTLINRNLGSFLFLGELLTDAEITPNHPVESLCGDCALCLEACPTEAIGRKTGLDARRCISYLTLEHRSEIPKEFQGRLAGYVAGCDLCQTCCPHNSGAPARREKAFDPKPGMAELTLETLRGWDPPDFSRLATGSALERVRTPMWKRNIDANTPAS